MYAKVPKSFQNHKSPLEHTKANKTGTTCTKIGRKLLTCVGEAFISSDLGVVKTRSLLSPNLGSGLRMMSSTIGVQWCRVELGVQQLVGFTSGPQRCLLGLSLFSTLSIPGIKSKLGLDLASESSIKI
ncbi:hypothetical protein PanWU01x14_158270 [Parasponia andersonii]|uniref:Uncharacterized protein n=1 Tax=Parasponia andersonii TaxID=3476 RepID=A0A2P5CF29_PARAD|nr:hypothetical protein PanWU01x14_158270 [Parasponia andersonii]